MASEAHSGVRAAEVDLDADVAAAAWPWTKDQTAASACYLGEAAAVVDGPREVLLALFAGGDRKALRTFADVPGY